MPALPRLICRKGGLQGLRFSRGSPQEAPQKLATSVLTGIDAVNQFAVDVVQKRNLLPHLST
jgi:hypothetical protein